MGKKIWLLSNREKGRDSDLKQKRAQFSSLKQDESVYLVEQVSEDQRGSEHKSSQRVESDLRRSRQTPFRRDKAKAKTCKVKKGKKRSNPPHSNQLKQNKPSPRKGHLRSLMTLLLGMLALVLMVISGLFVKGVLSVKTGQEATKPAQVAYFSGQETRDGTNILILGSDRRQTDGEEPARTDTIMVLNIGNRSGRPKLVSFMRDTLVTIDGVSEAGSPDSKLNSAYTIGQQSGHQGVELVRQTLKTNFDLDIQYYAMIDFETFALAIDTLFPEGVQMDAQFSTVNGQAVEAVEVPDDLGFASGGGLYQTIAAGPQRMTGKTLLNYARFRGDDEGDFGRVRRQQEVLQAVLSQVKDPTKLFTGSEALGKVYGLTATNISVPFMIKSGLSLLTAGSGGIERATIPDQGDWIDAYDRYGGQGLLIDFPTYQNRLLELGLR